MELILIQDVTKLGYADDVVNVKAGYGRNFLLPQGFAVLANDTNKKLLAERQKQNAKREAKFLADLQTTLDKLKATTLKIGAKVGSTDKIFGSVSSLQISEAIKAAAGVEVDRRKITIKEGDVKVLGNYTAVLSLHKDQILELPFEVVSE